MFVAFLWLYFLVCFSNYFDVQIDILKKSMAKHDEPDQYYLG